MIDVMVNEEKVEVDRRQRITVHDLLNHLKITQPNETLEVAVNGQEVPRARWLKFGIQERDRVRITHT